MIFCGMEGWGSSVETWPCFVLFFFFGGGGGCGIIISSSVGCGHNVKCQVFLLGKRVIGCICIKCPWLLGVGGHCTPSSL